MNGLPSPIGRGSSALRWRVRSPRGPVYLSDGQRSLLFTLHGLGRVKGATTSIDELLRLTAASSRGRVSDRLARLRQLGLVGYKSQRGPAGYVRFWFGRPAVRGGVETRARQKKVVGNDSTYPLSGDVYVCETHRNEADDPPGPSVASPGYAVKSADGRGRRLYGRHTPPRGVRPPRLIVGHCPNGHKTRSGRWSWRTTASASEATYRGRCRRCGVEVVEQLQLLRPVAVLVSRERTSAETADPDLWRRRVEFARGLVADPTTDPRLAARLRTDYLQ